MDSCELIRGIIFIWGESHICWYGVRYCYDCTDYTRVAGKTRLGTRFASYRFHRKHLKTHGY